MERWTESMTDRHYRVPEELVERNGAGGWSGLAIDRLGAYETLHEALFARRVAIPSELESLRVQGREKTVKFKELLAEKLMVEAFLSRLALHGLR